MCKKPRKFVKISKPAGVLYMEFYNINATKVYLIAYILYFSKPFYFSAGLEKNICIH